MRADVVKFLDGRQSSTGDDFVGIRLGAGDAYAPDALTVVEDWQSAFSWEYIVRHGVWLYLRDFFGQSRGATDDDAGMGFFLRD
jgi:hypothetical protein